MSYLAAFQYTLGVTVPIFLIVFLGLYLKRTGRIDDAFIGVASKLIFNICLPVLMFMAITQAEVSLAQQQALVVFAVLAALVSFLLAWWAAPWFAAASERGVFAQGAFRANLGILGIALCHNAYGLPGLATGALLLAVVTPAYNVLSIYALTRALHAGRPDWLKVLWEIARNPLIIAIALAFLCLALGLKLPAWAADTANYLGRMTLPLALIAIGGSLSLAALRATSRPATAAVVAKLVVLPLLITLVAYMLGMTGVVLGCVFLMFASPTATASFVMVKSMGGDAKLASNIIVASTLFSAVTISAGLYIIRALGWA